MVRFTLSEIWLRIKFVALAWILLVVGGSIIGGVLSALVGLPVRYSGWVIVFLMVAVPMWHLVMIARALFRLAGWSRATPEQKARIREALAAPVSSPGGHTRHIPQDVKVAVAARDGGRCRVCGSTSDLQYDHVVPFSRGGSSLDLANIQLLCGRHNRLKGDR